MKFFLIGLGITGLVFYGFYQLIVYLLTKNEARYQKEAHKVTWTHQDMLDIAKKKQDHQMNDEEFHLKYGMFRHETYRVMSIHRKIYNFINDFFYWIELYCYHFGPSNLDKTVKIDRPIFVIGDFRSGTSNLERLIAHHPDIGAFNMQHTFVWTCPMIWDKILMFLANLRLKLTGEYGPGHPDSKGIFFPHSSNNLLTRGRPFECENIWEWCQSCLSKNRHYNWDKLDSKTDNPDNNTNCDILTKNFSDEKFEILLKNSIKMLLYYQNKARFINKNPLNGFRLGYLKKVFPNAKFVYISRNPVKTCKSQLLLQESNCRAYWVDPQTWRKQNMKPKFAESHLDNPKDSTFYITHNQYPNDVYGNLWYPRVFPRTVPEHWEITKYLKKDEEASAFAVGVAQHERVVLEQIEDCGLIEGENLLTVWQEDLLEDAWTTYGNVMKFLELDMTDKERLEWLEREDFPNGQANKKRVESKSNKVKEIGFGKENDTINEILKACLDRFYQRKNKKQENVEMMKEETKTNEKEKEAEKEKEKETEKEKVIEKEKDSQTVDGKKSDNENSDDMEDWSTISKNGDIIETENK